jgi:hypothetical protein
MDPVPTRAPRVDTRLFRAPLFSVPASCPRELVSPSGSTQRGRSWRLGAVPVHLIPLSSWAIQKSRSYHSSISVAPRSIAITGSFRSLS